MVPAVPIEDRCGDCGAADGGLRQSGRAAVASVHDELLTVPLSVELPNVGEVVWVEPGMAAKLGEAQLVVFEELADLNALSLAGTDPFGRQFDLLVWEPASTVFANG